MQAAIKINKQTLLQVKRDGLSHSVQTFKAGLDLFAKMLSNKGVRIIHRGTDCYTTGTLIVLPELGVLERKNMTAEQLKESQEYLEAMRGFVTHEVGHILFTDWGAVKEASHREHGQIVHSLWNAIEDIFIEKKMSEEWSGAGLNLQNLSEWMCRKVASEEQPRSPLAQIMSGFGLVARVGKEHWFYKQLPDAVKKSLDQLAPEVARCRTVKNSWECLALATDLLAKLKKMLGEEEPQKQEPPKNEEKSRGDDDRDDSENRPMGASGADAEDPGAGEGDESEDSDQQSGDESKHGDGDQSDEPESSDGKSDRDGDGDSDDEGDDEDASDKSDASDSDDDSLDEGSKKPAKGSKKPQTDDPEDVGEQDEEQKKLQDKLRAELEDEEAAAKNVDGNQASKMLQTAAQAVCKDVEGEDRYLIWTTENDKVVTPEIDKYELSEYNELVKSLSNELQVARSQLGNLLKAKTLSFEVRDLEQGKLDRKRLHRLAASGRPNVFKEKIERADLKNVSCCLLINLSGSMDLAAGGNGKYQTRLQVAIETAVLFGEALDAVNIPFELIGHSTGMNEGPEQWRKADANAHKVYSRWGANHFEIYKGFDDKWKRCSARLMSARTRCNTHDAEALLFAANRMLERKSDVRRVIFTVDDGEPFPNIFPPYLHPEADPDYQEKYKICRRHNEHLIETVKEIERKKVEIIGVGMGTESVRRFYPHHVVVRSVSDFPKILLNEMKRVLLPGARR